MRCLSVLLEPHVPRFISSSFGRTKFSDHFRIAFRINCNGTVVFFKEVRANYPTFEKSTPNSDPVTMQRLLMKFSWVVSNSIAYVLLIHATGNVTKQYERLRRQVLPGAIHKLFGER